MKENILFPQSGLKAFREVGDRLADDTVSTLFALDYNPLRNKDYADFQLNNQSYPATFPKVLVDYFNHIKEIALKEEIIEKGHQFFLAYGQSIMLCLGLYSLPYCYAAANGAKVLSFSKRIIEKPEVRLAETGEFVLDLHAPDAFKNSGRALISIAKVRLMHAAIRYHLLQSTKWDAEWGFPINQMDMAGTNYSFSLIVIRGLRKLGFDISTKQSEDYLQFWNEVGKLLGLNEELMPHTNKEAYILEQKISNDQFKSSEEGRVLTKSLLNYVDGQETPFPVKGSVIAAYLLGEDLSKMLGINSSTISSAFINPFRLFNGVQQKIIGSKQSYQSILKELRLAQLNTQPTNSFNFLMTLVDE